MASQKQIEANRRNARNSTGPRSRAAKKRSGQNAYKHGLASGFASHAAVAKRRDELARQIAGDSEEGIILEYARAAAQAELDLARVRRVRVAVINRVHAMGALGPAYDMGSVIRAYLYVELALEGKAPRGRPPAIPELIDPLATMPTQEPERTAEAVRRALPELIKLNRYEAQAVSRRDRAIREIVKIRLSGDCRSRQ
jgi:hypothetical protein